MVLGGLIALYASVAVGNVADVAKAVPFGQADPILGRDVSFYVFTLPFLQFVRGIAQTLVVLAALGAGALYLISGQPDIRVPCAPLDDAGGPPALSLLVGAVFPAAGRRRLARALRICSCTRPA